MKRLFALAICFIFSCMLFGCGSQNQTPQAKSESAANSSPSSAAAANGKIPIKFTDQVFEKLIRMSLGKMSGDIYESDLAPIKQIVLASDPSTPGASFKLSYQEPIAEEQYALLQHGYDGSDMISVKSAIESVEDLKYFTGLVSLYLSFAANIDFVKDMPKLKYLAVWGGNFHDIGPLESCKELDALDLKSNNIIDFSPIEKLLNLKKLSVSQCYGADKWKFSARINAIIANSK